MNKIKSVLTPIFALFTGIQVILYLVIIMAMSTMYLFQLSKQPVISMTIGLITAFLFFYFVVYIQRKIDREHFLTKELQKYATNMTFYMQSGYNVIQALDKAKENLDKEIKSDVEKTIKKLRDKAVLETSHFKKYKFQSINIFHEILKIKYEKGGNTKDLFANINKSINFEIVKRDEMYRGKKYMRNKIMVMMLMVLAIPFIISMMAKDVYITFLSSGLPALGITLFVYTAVLVSYFILQRSVSDLSLQ